MCIRDRAGVAGLAELALDFALRFLSPKGALLVKVFHGAGSVSYTHLRAHETVLDLVCRLLLEKKHIQTSHATTTLLQIQRSKIT